MAKKHMTRVSKKQIQRQRKTNIEEPSIENITTDSDLIRVLGWYYRENPFKEKDIKSWVVQYAVDNKVLNKENLKKLRGISGKNFNHPLTSVCRVANRGYEISKKNRSWIKTKIENLIVNYKPEILKTVEKTDKVNRPSIQDRMREQVQVICAELDYAVDSIIEGKDIEFNIVKWIEDSNPGRPQTKYVIEHAKQYLDEFEEVLNTKDKVLKEGYKNFKKKTIREIIKYMKHIITACDAWIGAKKKALKPRQPKRKSPEEIVKRVKYSDKSSIRPTKILGSNYLVVYNEKYNKVYLYKAADKDGFIITGTSLKNFDEKKTLIKTVVKNKIEAFLKKATAAKKISDIKKIFTNESLIVQREIKASGNGRLNENIILLNAI